MIMIMIVMLIITHLNHNHDHSNLDWVPKRFFSASNFPMVSGVQFRLEKRLEKTDHHTDHPLAPIILKTRETVIHYPSAWKARCSNSEERTRSWRGTFQPLAEQRSAFWQVKAISGPHFASSLAPVGHLCWSQSSWPDWKKLALHSIEKSRHTDKRTNKSACCWRNHAACRGNTGERSVGLQPQAKAPKRQAYPQADVDLTILKLVHCLCL